ncbi:MAG: VanW family protein [Oscillospiraceae bacterium]|jgi:vancomycin resistance protein YoaR|nr:VanW family protein [Oscillospiraceae bacterium]
MSQSVATKTPAKTAKPANAGRRRVLTPLGIVLLSVVGLLFIAFVSASAYALTYSRVYPGLSAYGIDFGGMTREEAGRALADKVDEIYAGTSVTLSLDGQALAITAEDAHVSLSAYDAAEAVYQAGRTGGLFSRLSFAFSSLYSRHTVDIEESAFGFYINREAVHSIVSPLCDGLFQQPVEYSWEIGKKSIEVEGGRDGASSDPDSMTDAVVRRFADRDFSPLSFASEAVPPAPLPLEELHGQIYVEPRDAHITLDDDRQASIVSHVTGVSFDMQKAQEQLAARPERLSIPLVYAEPDITAAILEDSLFRDLLGQYATSTSGSSQNRITNIDLTAQAMNGAILLPGEEFSFNNVVGERSEARGYKPAGAFLNGQIVDDIGGGVCQSSTTLYNAVLLSNLNIVFRQAHSMTVTYVPLGQDAAVDWGRIDFVFSNDTAYPVRVTAWYANQRLTVQVWGTKTDDLTVSIESDIIAHRPAQTLTEHNPELAPGTKKTKNPGSDGWTVQTYRVLKDPEGKVVYRNPEARSGYMKVDTVIEMGTPAGGDLPDGPPVVPVTPNPTPDPEPEPEPTTEPEQPASIPGQPDTETEEDLNDL